MKSKKELRKDIVTKYKKFCENGYMDEVGLCNSFSEHSKMISLFKPNYLECQNYSILSIFWGFEGDFDDKDKTRIFSDLRKTIICFIIAMYE